MDLISVNFLFFVLAALAVYYLLPFRFQNAWLLVVSFAFYLTWGIGVTLLLIGVGLVNFALGHWLGLEPARRRSVLILGLILDAGALLLFRLTASGTIIRAIEYITRQPADGSLSILNVLVPIGFSFYILQAISYLIDVYHRQIPPCENPIDFMLYMAYFPRLLSGPIERARTFLPQLASPRRVDVDRLARSFVLLTVGLLRKVLIAEVLKAVIPEYMFTRPLQYANTDLIFGIAVYGFWLYNDFAGYTAIVRGVSGFFGIELSPNFQQPFFARSFVEFWNRWHMSLSFWLRDYIYFPLSRSLLRKIPNPKNLLNIFIPPLATMLLSGFWHNLGLYTLAWGGLHGLYQALERYITLHKPALPVQKRPATIQIVNALTINALLIPTWILFASGGLQKAFRFTLALFTAGGTPFLLPSQMIAPVAWIIISLLIDWLQYHAADEYVFLRWGRFARAGALAAVGAALLLNGLWSQVPVASFIYQGF